MFSWKNIKETYEDKVKFASGTDKLLGIGEVLGKSVVGGATALAKNLPEMTENMEHYASKRNNQRNLDSINERLKDKSLSDEERTSLLQTKRDAKAESHRLSQLETERRREREANRSNDSD